MVRCRFANRRAAPNIEGRHLSYTTDLVKALDGTDAFLFAVCEADLAYMMTTVEEAADALRGYTAYFVVVKTMLIGLIQIQEVVTRHVRDSRILLYD